MSVRQSRPAVACNQIRSAEADGRVGLRRLEQSSYERLGVEFGQVAGFFAGAYEQDGDLQLVDDGEDDPAFGGAIQLGQDQPIQASGFFEGAALDDGVLASRGVQHQQRAYVGNLLAFQNTTDLLELLHQVDLGVQPTGGVHNQQV